LLEHSLVYEYFDDYGYASLSFVNNIPNVQGTHFNLSQLLHFYKLHYFTITGRIFSQSLMTITLSAGLWCIRIVQCITITLTLYMIYKLLTYRLPQDRENPGAKRNRVLVAFVVCLSYGLLELYILDKSIYWFTASSTYLWPLLPLLFGIYIYYRYMQGDSFNPWMKAAALLCLAFSAASQEQIAVATLIIIFGLLAIKIFKQKSVSRFDILAVVFILGGALFLFLSPSNAVRSEALKLEPSFIEYLNMPVVHRITVGFRIMLQYLFSKNYYLLMIGLLSSGSYMGVKLFREKKGFFIVNIILAVLSLFSLTAMLVYNDGLFTLIVAKGFSDKLAYLYIGFICLLLLYGFIAYYQKKKNPFMWILFIAGAISAGSVIVSFLPVSSRLYIPFAVFSLVLIGDAVCDFLHTIRTKHIKTLFLILLTAVIAANVINYTKLVYKTTGPIIDNDLRLKDAATRIHNGEYITVIQLKPFPNIESDALRPKSGTYTIYRQNTLDCIKEFYDIPPSVKFAFDE
jgi:hypothetical protein